MSATVAKFTALKRLRKAKGYTQQQLAEALKTTQQTVARWEKGTNEIPVSQLKEMAVLFGVSVDSILGVRTPDEVRARSPFAIDSMESAEPYGTLRITLSALEVEYPVDEKARESLLHQLSSFDIQGNNTRRPWLYCWSLDNKIVFANPDHVSRAELIGDDAEAMPAFEHPEVYQALEDWDFQEYELGKGIVARCKELFRTFGEEEAKRQATHVRVISKDGEESWHALIEPEDASGYFCLELEALTDIPSNRFIRVESEGYYRDRFINLSHASLLEVPTNLYLRLNSVE